MDTSEKYIKMCEKAEQIQKGYYPETHDFTYCRKHCIDLWLGKCGLRGCKEVWLPRQDQLQGMLNMKPTRYGLNELFNFKNNTFGIKSWEELWLRFTMKEKFNKTWNDQKEEWE